METTLERNKKEEWAFDGGPGADIDFDFHNQRLWVKKYHSSALSGMPEELVHLAEERGLEKIICPARGEDWIYFLSRDYIMEAYDPYFFRGRPGYYMVRYLENERQRPVNIAQEHDILTEALSRPKEPPRTLDSGFVIRSASTDDIPDMIPLFKRVFATYPTPLHQEEYLRTVIADNTFFEIICDNRGQIVSAASTDIDNDNLRAEITDCATDPDFRGRGFMAILVSTLEEEMKQKGLVSIFSIARSVSAGINITLSKMGHTFGGRLVQNCDICGRFEDMNLWYKSIR